MDAALAKIKNGKAPGADGIHPEFLKYGLDDSGRDYLRSLIDATVYTGYLPHLWKHAYWIPLLKPTKPPEDSASYRPTSLTSVVSKVAERVLDTRIRAHPCCTIDDSQHAFRRTHRSEDALARLMDCTNRSWNAAYVGTFGAHQRHSLSSGRASVTLLDLSSAFDNVRYDKFHQRLRQMGFPSYMQRWLMTFLMGRTAQLFIHGQLTRNRQLTRGVPQGTVLGPLIFLLYVNPLVETIRTIPRVEPILFADDITLATVGNTAVECAASTQLAVDKVSVWTADHGLPLAPAKTHALLLTPSTHPEPNAGITIGTTNIPITPQFNPACKLLGVALDSRLSFPRHIAAIRSKASASLRLIQRAITHCGPSIHTLRTFGKALIESRLFYAAGSWGASVSDFEMTHLETTQRDLARAITGIPAAAPSAATLLEANLLPASVVIPTKVVALTERWRRLPPDDLRNKLIHRPLPTPQASQFGRAPAFFPHPWASAETTLNAVLTHRHVSPVHPRIPLLLHRRTAPHQTAGLSKVFIYPTADGAPNALPDKDTPDGATLRKELNSASWHAIQHRHGPFTAEVWTDGGVLHGEQPECLSAAAGHLYLAHSPTPVATFAASVGRLACSYTAKFTAMLGSVCQFASAISDSSIILLATDSQSLLQALAKGPLLTEEEHEDRLWAEFLQLTKRGCTVVAQFFYSHVGFPDRNQHVDSAVSDLLEAAAVDQDAAPIWYTDIVRATQLYLY